MRRDVSEPSGGVGGGVKDDESLLVGVLRGGERPDELPL